MTAFFLVFTATLSPLPFCGCIRTKFRSEAIVNFTIDNHREWAWRRQYLQGGNVIAGSYGQYFPASSDV